jgi:uncharacterized membrane protein YjdF
MPARQSFHHIGILTRNLGESLNLYEQVFHYKQKMESLRIPSWRLKSPVSSGMTPPELS